MEYVVKYIATLFSTALKKSYIANRRVGGRARPKSPRNVRPTTIGEIAQDQCICYTLHREAMYQKFGMLIAIYRHEGAIGLLCRVMCNISVSHLCIFGIQFLAVERAAPGLSPGLTQEVRHCMPGSCPFTLLLPMNEF